MARNDMIIVVMRGLGNFSCDFVRVAIRPSGKADLFQEELRSAQEKTFLSCGICHQLNANVRTGPLETFLGSQFPSCKLNTPQEQHCPAALTCGSDVFAGKRHKALQLKRLA